MKVKLINYGDATRVVYDTKGNAVSIPIGCVKSADLSDATHARIARRQGKDTLMFIDGDAEMSHELQQIMDYLADYDAVSYDNALSFSDSVLGPGALGLRPDKRVIRMALARRAADLAIGRPVVEHTNVPAAMLSDLAAGITGAVIVEQEEPSEEDYDFTKETDEASPPAPPEIKER